MTAPRIVRCDAATGVGWDGDLDCILPLGHTEQSNPTPHLDRTGLWWLPATDEDLNTHKQPR